MAAGVLSGEPTFIREAIREDNLVSGANWHEPLAEFKLHYQQEFVLRITQQMEVAFNYIEFIHFNIYILVHLTKHENHAEDSDPVVFFQHSPAKNESKRRLV